WWMLQLHATDGFTSWFEGLSDQLAEQVAVGVELIQQLGPERAPEQSSDRLLWYQCIGDPALATPRFQRLMRDFTEHSARVRRMVKHLESELARRKLAELPDERAALAFATLRRIAERTHWLQRQPGEARVLEDIQALSRSVYEALGLALPVDVPETGLREWTLSSSQPALRVLYGVDTAQSRGLLISGEPLDRSAYGPSVRHALALWSEFLAGSLQHRSAP
ncbi:MAG TPA: hypothetical protein VMF89_31180, partial [Polyangiales bacterium]|nr:hypothetical protein [Polyangiales bacterium]